MVSRTTKIALAGILSVNFHAHAQYANCNKHKLEIKQQANIHFAKNAPTAAIAGMFFQESTCNENATNKLDGGAGLGQLTGANNIKWIGVSSGIGTIDPYNVKENIRASVWLLKFNYDRVEGLDACEKLAPALSAYNGGLKNVQLAQDISPYKTIWFDVTERVRHSQARQSIENVNYARSYPRKILFRHQQHFETWGTVLCREYSYYGKWSMKNWVPIK